MEGGRGGTCACCPKMRPPYPWRFCHGGPWQSGRREQRRAPRRHQPRHSPLPKAAACVHLRRRCSPRISAATTAGPHGTEFGCGRCHEHKGAERCIQGSALLEGSWLEAAPHPSCRRDRGRRRRPCSRRPCIESHTVVQAKPTMLVHIIRPSSAWLEAAQPQEVQGPLLVVPRLLFDNRDGIRRPRAETSLSRTSA